MRARWSRTSKLYVAASVSCAAVAGAMVHGYAALHAAAENLLAPSVNGVIVATPISRGNAVRADEVRVASMPSRFAPPRALTSVGQAAGRVALTDLSVGEAVTQTRLAR